MAFYVDTSAFLKLVVREERSTPLRRWLGQPGREVFSSHLMRTEALRVARRHSPAALAEARSRFDVLAMLTMTPDVFVLAAELDPAVLRTLDASHLAAALTLADELEGVVTYDDHLAKAAGLHGVAVVSPGLA